MFTQIFPHTFHADVSATARPLYRDHLDRKVWIDIEGPACLHFLNPPSNSSFEVDGIIAPIKNLVHFDLSFRLLSEVNNLEFCAGLETQAATDLWKSIRTRHVKVPKGQVIQGIGILERGAAWIDENQRVESKTSGEICFFQSIQAITDCAARIIEAEQLGQVRTFSAENHRGEAKKSAGIVAVQNVSKVVHLGSTFSNQHWLEASKLVHLNTATYPSVEACDFLLLRRVFDRFHGRQRARVLLNGQPMGWWYSAIEDRICRWQNGHFLLDVRGQGELTVQIDPAAGTPLWSVASFEIQPIHLV